MGLYLAQSAESPFLNKAVTTAWCQASGASFSVQHLLHSFVAHSHAAVPGLHVAFESSPGMP
eukprot:3823001-Pyramimonas_sp.AAC.1